MNEPKPDTPFPRHRYYYVALKFAVILAAFAVATFVFGQFW